ncbi:hypothetical protein PVAP13_9KG063457 [Panicum virgatum]|uniref:Uncharacterized protein n=1 Tax=Panicum virgatum TaxID=38727 RepID=A0A8T0NIQ3_PANVG|nr:hypothetical protein PVAP13_9KG063457 [Panicum virgatum]
MPRTLASRDGDTASPIPDAMMRSRDPSLGLAGARVGRSIATGAPSRLSEEVWCGLAARDAGGPESCAPSRCSTDCAGARYTRSAELVDYHYCEYQKAEEYKREKHNIVVQCATTN